MLRSGQMTDGIVQLKEALGRWDAAGGKIWSPYIKSVLGEALALSGDIESGLALVNAMQEQIERPGWEEKCQYAEVLRLKGRILALKGSVDEAEKYFRRSIDFARLQHAKGWELRTSTSLARLWQRQGKRKEAPVYNWFTEGFDTKDLKEANALLDELDTSV